MHRISQQLSLRRKQSEIHAPRVNADPGNILMSCLKRFQDALFQLKKQTREIPRKRPVHHDGIAGKTVELRQRKPGAVEFSQNGSAAARAVIESQ